METMPNDKAGYAPERQHDDEARAWEWEAAMLHHGVLDPGQPTEAAHLRFLDQPHVRLMRDEARRRYRRETIIRRGLERTAEARDG